MYNSLLLNYLQQMETIQKATKFPGSDFLQQISGVAGAVEKYASVSEQLMEIQNINHSVCKIAETTILPVSRQLSQYNKMNEILGSFASKWKLASIYQDEITDEEKEEIEKSDSEIVSQIYSESDIEDSDEESQIIILSPINDRVLKYLVENPMAWYQLQDNDFELAIAEIYHKLGYNVERTQSTRDGGKDIIIRKPEVLGDFIYYVECKKYAPNRPVGVGIVRNLVGTINTDRVNGGILATTSFFTRDARKFVLDNKLDYQIKMHDYNKIQQLLNSVV